MMQRSWVCLSDIFYFLQVELLRNLDFRADSDNKGDEGDSSHEDTKITKTTTTIWKRR